MELELATLTDIHDELARRHMVGDNSDFVLIIDDSILVGRNTTSAKLIHYGALLEVIGENEKPVT